MNDGQYVFSQIMAFAPGRDFRRIVAHYKGNSGLRSFSCWHQFLALCFGQLSLRESLRDIVTCLKAHDRSLYHLGLSTSVPRSTFADANNNRDWRIFADFARLLMRKAQRAYRALPADLPDLDKAVYALDGSIIKLCLSLFPWANYQNTIAGVRLHVMLDLNTNIPGQLEVTRTHVHELQVLKTLSFDPGAVYIMDRGYFQYSELYRIHRQGAFFVIRGRSNSAFSRSRSLPNSNRPLIKYDQIGRPSSYVGQKAYPATIRRLKVKDLETDKTLILFTNMRKAEALKVAELYRRRWQIELFFKWIKQHLKIKAFWGRTENAVKVQMWSALASYMLLAIIRKELNISLSMHEMVQIISVSLLSKMPLNQLFTSADAQKRTGYDPNQLKIWNL